MARFSVTEAATAGFGVIGRKPLAVVGWAVALALALMVPAVLCFLTLGPEFQKLVQLAMTQRGGDPSPEAMQQMMQAQSGMTAVNMLFWLWSSFVKAVFCAAVFRAVLTPGQSAWAYLRIGSREMWLTLLLLVEQVLAMIAIFVLVLLVVVLTAIVAVGGGESGHMAAIATGCVGALIAFGVVFWVALRLSMAAPMTFVDNQFRLFESWSLTRGQGWRLLGVAVLIVVFILGLEILVGGVVVGVALGGGALAALQGPGGLEAFMARPPLELLRDLWPWLVVFGTVAALFSAVVHALFYAPWAVIHRALTTRA
ncbi:MULTISPECIES: hypothetical protein [unclassified Caulobacter]|jgi:hypothetical protein|uniref:hypothetical protein n=1 Tax=unclassified Caulobacter TaxID=2648921 RepID=UPI0006FCDEE7|nr:MULTISPECIES: hypothetical protein [unclassified Caulobacter]KQV56499.1 hypothetical protein ASC62_09200 [Caulobacter sp. Root342]KQV72134.1 hypothetical protein ASC70_00150 [Caulobacter sp. Root343]